MNTNTPTLDQLQRGLQLAEQIATLEAEMTAIFAGNAVPTPVVAPTPEKTKSAGKGRRKLSAQALANIRAAQKERWAKVKGQKEPSKAAAPKVAAKTTRKLSPQALANIRAAQKKRWAKVEKQNTPAKAAAPEAPVKKKRKLAPEVRAKLAAAMKARWEAAKKSGGPAPTAKK